MKFTFSWLKKFLDTTADIETIATTLTELGLEVEKIIDRSDELKDFIIVEIIDINPHPNADRLKICSVYNGKEIFKIVCGAPNVIVGMKSVLASVGTLIPNGEFKIKKSTIRGVESNGMLCSEFELLLSNDQDGIIHLDSKAPVGQNFAEYLELHDPIIEVSITPNRGDCLSVLGIARELAAKGLGKLKEIPISKIREITKGSEDYGHFKMPNRVEVNVQNLDSCPLFYLMEITNIQTQESPLWLKNALRNIGAKSICAVVDIANYICYSYGQPLHIYDKDKISSPLFVGCRTGSKSSINALNNKQYNLNEKDIVVFDCNKIHALAGIIGSKESGCDFNTKNIVIEAAVFNTKSIATTGRFHNINTDSRYRFERGVDGNFVGEAIKIATEMIVRICGGFPSLKLQKHGSILSTKQIKFNLQNIKLKTGLTLCNEEAIKILENLGFKIEEKNNDILVIDVPSWRHDINIEEDLIEEIARIHGYDKLPLVNLSTYGKISFISQQQKLYHDTKRILAGCGYDEVITYSFMDSNKAALFTKIDEGLKLKNPISPTLNYMRPTIIPNILEIIQRNKARSCDSLSLFEMGPIFKGLDPKDEITRLVGARYGNKFSKNVHKKSNKFNAFDVKADFEFLIKELYLNTGIEYTNFLDLADKSDLPTYYNKGKACRIDFFYLWSTSHIGYLGEIDPVILKEYNIEDSVIIFEIFLDSNKLLFLYEQRRLNGRLFIYSDFQAIVRDYAFILSKDQPIGPIIKSLDSINPQLIKKIELFDVYTVNEEEQSVAFSITIQANDRTLKENELTVLQNRIIDTVCDEFNAKIR